MKITLTQEEILRALDAYVACKGIATKGKFTLSCQWDQRDEVNPHDFAATAEIERTINV